MYFTVKRKNSDIYKVCDKVVSCERKEIIQIHSDYFIYGIQQRQVIILLLGVGEYTECYQKTRDSSSLCYLLKVLMRAAGNGAYRNVIILKGHWFMPSW